MNANYSTNGSSLEDCFTNTFALADLGNIKWRGFCLNNDALCNQNSNNTNATPQSTTDTLDCPVLSSYIKCLNKDILCVWRRVVNNNNTGVTSKDTAHSTNAKNYTKQLWCFWFNHEWKHEFNQLIHKDLIVYEQSDFDHGLSYECRTLLFKAYHNLIEQSLLSIGFCKLGKFFIFPVDNQSSQHTSSHARSSHLHPNHLDSSHFSKLLQNTIQLVANSNRLAFAFNFFIHGENTVCCIIDVRLKNPIYRLTKSHITNALHQQQPIDVILAPYGLSAILTGHSSKENDNQLAKDHNKVINDWRKIFPFIQQSSKDKQSKPLTSSTANIAPASTSSLISSIVPLKIETLEDSFNSIHSKPASQTATSQLPTLVEVVVAGIKMKYPSSFVYMLQPNEHLATSKKRTIDLCKFEFSSSSSNSNKKSSISSAQQKANHNDSQETVQDLLFTSNHQLKDSNSTQLDKHFNFKLSPCQPQLPTLSYCIRSNLNQELNCAPTTRPASNDQQDEQQTDEAIAQSLNKWDIYDVTCKLGCQCSRCKPKKKEQLKSSSSSSGQPNKSSKLDKSNKKENKQSGGNYQFKFNIPFHRRTCLLTNSFDLESSRCFAEVTNESNDKNALTNNNSINNSSQSTRLPNYFSKNTNHLPATTKALTDALADTNSSKMEVDHQLTNGDEHSCASKKQNENSTNQQQQQEEKFEEDMFSPYSGDKSNTNSPNLASVQWNAFQSSSTSLNAKENTSSNKLESSGNDKKTSTSYHDTATNDAIVVVSSFNKNLYKQYTHRSGPIKRPLLPSESHLNVGVACDGNQSKSLLYDFELINNLNLNWAQPTSRNKRLIKGVANDELGSCSNDARSADNEENSRDPYEFGDDCMRNSRKSSNSNQDKRSNDDQSTTGQAPADSKQQNPTNSKQLPDKDNPLLNKILTREEDITVSASLDLDRIFDSGDESNDTFPVPGAPPITDNYNHNTSKHNGKSGSINNHNNYCSNMLCDISHMFPTPPSLEPNTAPSPYSIINLAESILSDEIITKEKLDIYPLSPLDSIKDVACVYATPLQTKFITSSRYAPLSGISVSNLKIPDECNYKSKLEKQKAKSLLSASIICPTNKQASSSPSSTSKANSNSNANNKSGYTDVQSLINSSSSSLANQFNSPHNHLNVNKVTFGHLSSSSSNAMNSKTNLNSTSSSSFMFDNGTKSKALSASTQFAGDIVMKKQPFELSTQSSSQFSGQQSIGFTNLPEINSVVVSLVLSDSMLNIFKDHNFESCPMCICNMNIKGSDVDVYLPDNIMPNDEAQYKCSCGFSALQNRHLSSYAGLFYEDEFEITNVCYDPVERLERRPLFNIDMIDRKSSSTTLKKNANHDELRTKHDQLEPRIIDLLKSQCAVIFCTSSLLSKSLYFELFKKRDVECSTDESKMPILLNSRRLVSKRIFLQRTNALLRSDCCEITFLALMLGRQGLEGFPNKSILQQYNQIENVRRRKQDCIHEWIFDAGTVHSNNYEVVQFLKNMQTLLQETVQKKLKDLGSTPSNAKGQFKLLTWRELYKLTGRSEDQSEPQPIPSLLVAHDRDWIALSPFALKWWKKCSLEPYSFKRDIGYLVLCPDTDHIVNGTKSFFKDLSSVYQMLKLGKHKPIYKIAKDGIITVGKESLKSNKEQPDVDEWFNNIGNGSVATKLKMYAQICKQTSQDHIKTLNLDKTIFEHHPMKNSTNSNTNVTENGGSSSINLMGGAHQTPNLNKINNSSVSSPLNNSEAMNGIDKPNEDGNQESFNANTSNATNHETADTDDDIRQPHIVVYIVEPFTFTNLDEDTYRVSCLGLLRCYMQMIEGLPENLRNNINLQVVSLDAVLQIGKDAQKSTRYDQFKSLAFSVFNQCRKVLVHQSISKSLTGFGPAASLENFLKSKDSSITNVSKVYMPPFILAPLKDKQTELGEMFGDRTERSQILFASYCLTEDQKFIAVTCCNEKGDLVENSLINIQIPNRTMHKKANVIRFALQKLMDFLISVMSESTQPWRLVLNKIGRVGHNELKEWANCLSKRSLLKFSKQLKEKCKQCSYLANYEMPSILSACLTSLEPDTNLRVFADQFVETESMNSCQLSTPEETSTTHILVFPTSSTTQSSQGNYTGIDALEDDVLGVGGLIDDDLGVDDMFDWGSPPGSPSRDRVNQLDSPGSRNNAFDTGNLRNMESDTQEEPCQLLQQPLSLGYYVSTAKTGKLPKWFWSSCQHLEDCNPSFLKSALLINTPSVHQVTDDPFTTSTAKSSHPLDSQYTTDVLRYVLESYNSLSWLVLDPSTHDRMSCLPLHIQLLMQLYHTVQALF